MSHERRFPDERTDASASERFQRWARDLFRVDKRDVQKHEPVKRTRSAASSK